MAKRFEDDGSFTARLLFNTVPEAAQILESGKDLLQLYNEKKARAAKKAEEKSSDASPPEETDVPDSPAWEYSQMSIILVILLTMIKFFVDLRKVLFRDRQKKFANFGP